MAPQRTKRQEHLTGAGELLQALGPGRDALCSALARVPPTGPTYAVLDAVVEAIDAAVAHLLRQAVERGT